MSTDLEYGWPVFYSIENIPDYLPRFVAARCATHHAIYMQGSYPPYFAEFSITSNYYRSIMQVVGKVLEEMLLAQSQFELPFSPEQWAKDYVWCWHGKTGAELVDIMRRCHDRLHGFGPDLSDLYKDYESNVKEVFRVFAAWCAEYPTAQFNIRG